MRERGEVRVKLRVGNRDRVINFKDMDVSMPIASMRQTLRAGKSRLVIDEDEGFGYIEDKKTGEKIDLAVRHGVYFFKAKILSPDSSLGFARQG